ncbi:MAG: autotransporter outer membrane beta-barrel domain-containing protein [Akkermansia sp.]|nr:autotransporter outer membrane beta-barrel domain-containing protein [Akkermansia sp.]
MKLKLFCYTLIATLIATPAMGEMASQTITLNSYPHDDNPVYDEWDDIDYTEHSYYVEDANIRLNGNLKLGKYDDVYITWNGNSETTYKLTGSGKTISAWGWTDWYIGDGTYVFEAKGSPSIYDDMSGNGDSHIIFNASVALDWIHEFSSITFTNKNSKVYHISNVDTIYAKADISSKNMPNILSACTTVVGNVILNGAPKGYTLTFPTEAYESEDVTRVYGNVNISGKSSLVHTIYWGDYSSDASCDECDGWHTAPPREVIDQAIESLGEDFIVFSCKSYSGKLENLKLAIGYEKSYRDEEGCYTNGDVFIVKTEDLGTFIPVYNTESGLYDMTFKTYTNAANAASLRPGKFSTYSVFGQDIYLPKAITLSSSDICTLVWDGESESRVLMGKGALSAQKGLNVKLLDGSFSVLNSCSFKNATYVLNNAYLAMGSALTAQSFALENKSGLSLKADKALKLTTKDKIALNRLRASHLYVAGSVNIGGHLSVGKQSSIALSDPSPKNKAMNLTVKGDFELTDRSVLTLSGAISAANMLIEDSTICMKGSKFQTIKVKDSLTLNGSNEIYLDFNVSAKDVSKKKAFKLFTFKSTNVNTEKELYSLLGLDSNFCKLAFDAKKKSILLTVTDLREWNEYMRDDDPWLTSAAATYEAVSPLDKASDTLVQTTWGAAKANRAFVDSIATRTQNTASLEQGRGAAWATAFGSASRQSSHGGSLGAEHNLSGAAMGAEINTTEKHSIGVAMGITWGKVNTLSAFTVDQDSTHMALYGHSNLKKRATGELTLDWSAAYGRSENDATIWGTRYDWTQHTMQLDARLNYARTLNERSVVATFGGIQYLHVDSATPEAGVKADSLENARVEVGVNASYKATPQTTVRGEVSVFGDILRDNPACHLGDVCRGGSNPGRAGMNIGVGATHQINDHWNLHAGYNLELVPRATSHDVGVGATYHF